MHCRRAIVVVGFLLLIASRTWAKESAAPPASEALADYVTAPDDSFHWQKRREGKLGAGTYVELILTSQTWRGIVWKHQLFIYRPATIAKGSDAILVIAGGKWKPSLETPLAANAKPEELPQEAQIVASLAEILQAPAAVLRHVPQEPIFDGKVEDQIISYTFQKYIETGERDWPLLLPMVKSVVRAMDAIEEFADEEWNIEIDKFLVTGASKRGWTTWLTAAADPRVSAIAPMVIDMLNMTKHIELQKESYGTASEEISDYTEKGLDERLDSERGTNLRTIVDPYSYRQDLRLPKLIMLGTNDRYWPVDALNLYWDELEGEKHILYVPNRGHDLNDFPRVLGGVAALYQSLNGGSALPKLKWSYLASDEAAQLELESDTTPTTLRKWTASSPNRDFRNALWTAQIVDPSNEDERQFVLELPSPKEGFAAVFAEAQYPGKPLPFYLSTTIRVIEAK